MRKTLLNAVVVVFLAACSRLPSPPGLLSPGCANINDPFYDAAYMAGTVFYSPFRAGERVHLAADASLASNRPTLLWLRVIDTAAEPDALLFEQVSDPATALGYTFERDRAEVQLYWSVDAGVVGWTVACQGVGELGGGR